MRIELRRDRLLLPAAVLSVMLFLATGAYAAWEPTPAPREPVTAQDAAAITPLIPYQGRLLDPNTGQPKADGAYTMTFRIYDAATGDTALWTEAKDVEVRQGLFSTLLGDTTALDPDIFDGQELWLAVKVGGDEEATPRQQIAYAGYAIWASNADKLDGQEGTAFAAANHEHSGGDITSGTVAEPRIANSIARDSEKGAANVAFDYRIVAKRRGYEGERLGTPTPPDAEAPEPPRRTRADEVPEERPDLLAPNDVTSTQPRK